MRNGGPGASCRRIGYNNSLVLSSRTIVDVLPVDPASAAGSRGAEITIITRTSQMNGHQSLSFVPVPRGKACPARTHTRDLIVIHVLILFFGLLIVFSCFSLFSPFSLFLSFFHSRLFVFG